MYFTVLQDISIGLCERERKYAKALPITLLVLGKLVLLKKLSQSIFGNRAIYSRLLETGR